MIGVGLCGAHRVGKTTTAQAVAHRVGLPYLDAGVSGALKAIGINPGLPMDAPLRMLAQEYTLGHLEQIYKEQKGGFVTDRTPLDVAMYTLAQVNGHEPFPSKWVKAHIGRCMELTNRYFNLVAHVPRGIPILHEEGKAPADESYINHLCALSKGLVVEWALNYSDPDAQMGTLISMDGLSLEYRVERIFDAISTLSDSARMATAGAAIQ